MNLQYLIFQWRGKTKKWKRENLGGDRIGETSEKGGFGGEGGVGDPRFPKVGCVEGGAAGPELLVNPKYDDIVPLDFRIWLTIRF